MATISKGLQQSLTAEFGIPTDIKFLFKKEVDGCTDTEEIRAHKCILAMASNVFKKGFYGGLEDHGSIDITDVTKEAFEAMVNFIYDKKTNVGNYDHDLLCSIYYLADKYDIDALERETLEAIKCKEISAENVIDVGVLAIQYAVHDKLAEALYEASAKSLSMIFNGDLNKAAEYLSKMDSDDSLDLIRYKSALKIITRFPTTIVCVNCKVFPCITGVRLTRDNFVKGAKITACAIAGAIGLSSIEHGSQLCDDNTFLGVTKIGGTLRDFLRYYVFKC